MLTAIVTYVFFPPLFIHPRSPCSQNLIDYVKMSKGSNTHSLSPKPQTRSLPTLLQYPKSSTTRISHSDTWRNNSCCCCAQMIVNVVYQGPQNLNIIGEIQMHIEEFWRLKKQVLTHACSRSLSLSPTLVLQWPSPPWFHVAPFWSLEAHTSHPPPSC